MDLSLTEEQVALQDTVRSLLEDRFPLAAVRTCEKEPETSAEIFHSLFELGIGGMTLPENKGGLGLGMTELVVVHSELGSALAPMLFTVSTVQAACILTQAATSAAEVVLSKLIDGSALASCALTEPADLPGANLILEEGADGACINGARGFVAEGQNADYLVVHAHASDGEAALCLVDAKASGISMKSLDNLADLAMSRVEFAQVPVMAVLAKGQAVQTTLRSAATAMNIAVAAQAVGGAERVLGITRDYACTRQQFGQPIGAFQAIAHMLANASVNLEGARYLAYRAAAAADDGETAETWAAMAKLKACQMYRDVSALAIQVHGGIGFTMEADPQLFFRRAKHLQLMHGEPLDLQEQIGESLISGAHKVLAA